MARQVKSKSIRRNEAEWRALVSRYAQSGLSAAAFCQREALSTASLYRWRDLIEQHGGSEAVAARGEVGFLDLGSVGEQSGHGWPMELKLELGGGLSLHLVRR
jgi:putative transposase